MIFLSEKENLIVLHPKSQEILVTFQNGKCTIDEAEKEKIDLMLELGYKTENIEEVEIKRTSSKKKSKEVIL